MGFLRKSKDCMCIILVSFGAGILLDILFPPYILVALLTILLIAAGVCYLIL